MIAEVAKNSCGAHGADGQHRYMSVVNPRLLMSMLCCAWDI